MTIIAIERVDEAEGYDGPLPHMVVVADSRISNSGLIATDTAPKIFPVHVLAKHANGSSATFPLFGFAYAGSSLSASITHATATHLLTNLFTNDELKPLSTLDVANVYAEAARKQIHELAGRLQNPQNGFFKGLIVGYSPLLGQLQAFVITPRLSTSFEVEVAEVDFSSGHFRFGDGEHAFDETLASLTTESSKPSCMKVVATMVENARGTETVGGFVQFAIADSSGFQTAEVMELKPEGEHSVPRFMGVDITSLAAPEGYKFGTVAFGIRPPGAKPIEVGATITTAR